MCRAAKATRWRDDGDLTRLMNDSTPLSEYRSMNRASRREFLSHMGVAATALVAAPSLFAGVRTKDKSGLAPPTLGEGEHQYECVHDWARLPAEIAFGNTHGVAVDAAGFVYIKHTVHASSSRPDALCVFDPNGAFVRSFGAEFQGGAHGLLLSREKEGEFLYLADCNRGVVVKCDLKGEQVWTRSVPEESGLYANLAEYKPTNVAQVPDSLDSSFAGHLYIADGYGKSWIHHYDAAGTYLRSFGGPGRERGQVSCPHGIFVDTRGGEARLVVADRSNRRLQYFTLDGRHLSFVTDGVRAPCHFDTCGGMHGGLLLVPDLEGRVTLLDGENRPVAQLGDGWTDERKFALRDKSREQFIPGQFIAPHAACFDAKGDIFVVEWVEVGRVTKLRRVG